MKQSENMKT